MQAIGMSLGFWVSLGFTVLGILAIVAGYLLFRSDEYHDGWREFAGVGMAFTGGLAFILAGGSLVVGLFPYNPDYWPMYRIEGTVTSVSNVLTEDGGDLTRTPVVTLDTFDGPLVVDDVRAVNLDGKHVALRCDRHWVYQGADRWSCVIQSTR